MPTTKQIHEFIKRHDKHGLFDDENADVVLYGDEYLSGYIASHSQAQDIQRDLQNALGEIVQVTISEADPGHPVQIQINAQSLEKEFQAREQKQAMLIDNVCLTMDDGKKRIPDLLAPGAKGEGFLKRGNFMLTLKQQNAVRAKQLEMALKGEKTSIILNPEDTPELGPDDPLIIIGDRGEAIMLCEALALGEGAFGKVYLGQSLDSGDFCVIKDLKVQGDKAVFEFERENENLDGLNLLIDTISTYHRGQDDEVTERKMSAQPLAWGENFYDHLDMEHLDTNDDGFEVYARYDQHDFDERLEMYVKALEKIHAFHEAGWVHRDIKSRNIMWDPVTRQATLVDMGFAAPMDEFGRFLDKKVAGTPEAVDPELIKEEIAGFKKTYSSQTDAYSAGVLGLDMFSPETIYFGPDLLVLNIQNEDGDLLDEGIGAVFVGCSSIINNSQKYSEIEQKVHAQVMSLIEISPDKRADLKSTIENLKNIQKELKAKPTQAQPTPAPVVSTPDTTTPIATSSSSSISMSAFDLDISDLAPPQPPETAPANSMLPAFSRQSGQVSDLVKKFERLANAIVIKENTPNQVDAVTNAAIDLQIAKTKTDYNGPKPSNTDKDRAEQAVGRVLQAIQNTPEHQAAAKDSQRQRKQSRRAPVC